MLPLDEATGTGTMALALCPVGATDETAPSDNTYLNLQGMPAASIGDTVTIYSN